MSDKRLFLEVASTQVLGSSSKIPERFTGAKAVASMSVGLDLMFIHFILKHEGGNRNGDYFTRDELEDCYATYAGKPITWEHGQPYIGFITDSLLVKPSEEAEDPRWYIECAGVVWKSRYPQYAALIAQGAADGSRRISMECYFKDALYTVGESLEKLYTAEEAPELVALKGHKLHGQPVYRVLVGCHGGGAGIVENPADVDALLLSVARDENPHKNTKIVVDHEQCSAYVSVSNMEGFIDDTGGVEPTSEEKEVEEMNLDNQGDLLLKGELTQATDTDQLAAAEEPETVTEVEATEDVQAAEESEVANEAQSEDVGEEEVVEPTEDSIENADDGAQAEERRASVVERFSAEAATFNEYMERWADLDQFWDCFDAVYYAIEDAIYEGDDVEDKVRDAIDSFTKKILSLLPKVLEHWGIASVAKASEEYNEKIGKLESENASLKVKLVEANEAFEKFKNEVEEEKAEAARVALAEARLRELVEAGVTIPGDKLNSWTERLKTMDDVAYADFKDVLVANVTRASGENSEEEETELQATEARADLPPLNIEQSRGESLVQRYERLWEKIFSGEHLHKRF